MTYYTPRAFRVALEQRLRTRAEATGMPLDRLRRRVVFERFAARLERAEPGRWVLKGGMALEVRFGKKARVTKDVDLGLRESGVDPAALRERLIEALEHDPDADGFFFEVGPLQQMREDGAGQVSWRVSVRLSLAGSEFGRIKVDISPRPDELTATDRKTIPTALDFAGVRPVEMDIIDVHRHAAEKLHAMLRTYGDGESTRVRDLVDLMLILEHETIDQRRLAGVVRSVWRERNDADPPAAFPGLPESWPARYERLAADNDVEPSKFDEASARASELWAQTFPTKEA